MALGGKKERISRRHGGGNQRGDFTTEDTEVARESRLRAENPATGGTPTPLEESALLRCDRCGAVREKRKNLKAARRTRRVKRRPTTLAWETENE